MVPLRFKVDVIKTLIIALHYVVHSYAAAGFISFNALSPLSAQKPIWHNHFLASGNSESSSTNSILANRFKVAQRFAHTREKSLNPCRASRYPVFLPVRPSEFRIAKQKS